MKRLIPVFFLFSSLSSVAQLQYPQTRKESVSDDYFGVKIQDPYRWLENDRDPQTEEWVKQQNEVTNRHLLGIPGREKLRARLADIWNFNRQSAPFRRGDNYFCFRNNGLQNQSVMYILSHPRDAGKILLDPNKLSNDGTISLNGISVSNDGKTLAYGVSRAGSDWVDICFMDIRSGSTLRDTLHWVKFSGMSWRGNGIFYSRYDAPSGSALVQKNEFHKVFYHRLGNEQKSDSLVWEDRTHGDYNFHAQVTEDERFLFLYTSRSTSGTMLSMRDLRDPKGKPVQLANDFEHEYSVIDNVDDRIYMLTNDQAPMYRLVSFRAAAAAKKDWKDIIPQGKHLLEHAYLVEGRIIANYLENASSHLCSFTYEGVKEREIDLPGICRITAFNARKSDRECFYSIATFTSPEETFALRVPGYTSETLFHPDLKFRSEDYVTKQVFYNSGDGTRIPMFITHKKTLKPDTSTPCFVYGYGGFNISIAPEFRIDRTVFLEAGGIYCVPNLRGGGEFGEDWHKAGTKCRKQNVFDDFIAACEYLVKNKYTSFRKIAIHGRSNGGLLVGAVMTQRPDICRVAVPAVGVLDMLRFHKFTIGRAWTADYGSSENKEEFNCLLKYSPLHNVKKRAYPATMILTGDHDDRVVPAHSFKFAAALQEMNTSAEPVLIRVDVNAGHGAGKPTAKQIEEFADMWSFIFSNLGMPF